MGQPAHSSLPCPLSWKHSRCCATPVWEISSVYVDDRLGRSPLFMYLVLSSNKKLKQNRDFAGSRTREYLFKFKYFFVFVVFCSPWNQTQTRQTCLGLPSLLNQARWLTPFGFKILAWVSPQIQPISMEALTIRFINQTRHHVLFDWRRQF
jgi:hypothetical protein